MPDQEAIKGQLTLLETFRKRLRVQINQRNALGNFAPPYMQTEIDDAQAQIKKIKAYLRENHIAVDDLPEDAGEDASAQPPSQQLGANQYPQSPANVPQIQMPSAPEFKYDVFISYSHADEEWVENVLLKTLEDAGLRVCIDFRDFIPGKPSITNMQDAASESRHTVLVLTPAWLKSEWTLFETLLIRTKDPAGQQRRTIPLLVKPCEPDTIPEFISVVEWIDFTRPNRMEMAWRRLLAALSAPPA